MSDKVEKKFDKEFKGKFVYKKFNDIPVSTKTFIVNTNISINIRELFNILPITEYIVIPKKRGRKKKTNVQDPNKNIKNGSIITLDLENNIRGVLLKKRKKKEGTTTDYFRNSITVVMVIDGKKINFKVSRNGKFQMTGCKYDRQSEDCIKFIWEYIKDTDCYTMEGDHFSAIFLPAMRNIDFNLGFVVDRQKIDNYFNTNTDYYSLLETSIGYTGANIKIPVKKDLSYVKVKKLIYEEKDWNEDTFMSYMDYLELLKDKDKEKKISKDRYNTFLVFRSGKVIMSSMCEEFARDTYYDFLGIIFRNMEDFRENKE
jgi:TATA-box binding protein (TBP) (component of TFIID and TFIIIB)